MTCHLIITGSVQGVGYRQFVKSHAQKLGLTGWVKNLPDGSVEAQISGSNEQIEKMVYLCKKGSFLAEVKDLQITWMDDSEQFSTFEILKNT